MNDQREAYSVIEDDMLVRHIPIPDNQLVWKKEPVLTKEEFLKCFNAWVVKPLQENPVSLQSPFGIPVDNNGLTPSINGCHD